jgi:hypothetical protein
MMRRGNDPMILRADAASATIEAVSTASGKPKRGRPFGIHTRPRNVTAEHILQSTGTGAHWRANRLVKINGNTREGWFLTAVRTELIEHVGADPTAVQKLLIDRAAVLSLRLAQIDKKIFTEQ